MGFLVHYMQYTFFCVIVLLFVKMLTRITDYRYSRAWREVVFCLMLLRIALPFDLAWLRFDLEPYFSITQTAREKAVSNVASSKINILYSAGNETGESETDETAKQRESSVRVATKGHYKVDKMTNRVTWAADSKILDIHFSKYIERLLLAIWLGITAIMGIKKFLLVIMKVFHWFNPLVYIIAREWQMDMEFLCDEAVTAEMNGEERLKYNRVLLANVERANSRRSYGIGLNRDGRVLEKRMRLNMRHRKKNRLIASLVSVLILMSCFGTSCGRENKSDVTDKIQVDQNLKNYKKMDMSIGTLRGGVNKTFAGEMCLNNGVLEVLGMSVKVDNSEKFFIADYEPVKWEKNRWYYTKKLDSYRKDKLFKDIKYYNPFYGKRGNDNNFYLVLTRSSLPITDKSEILDQKMVKINADGRSEVLPINMVDDDNKPISVEAFSWGMFEDGNIMIQTSDKTAEIFDAKTGESIQRFDDICFQVYVGSTVFCTLSADKKGVVVYDEYGGDNPVNQIDYPEEIDNDIGSSIYSRF